MHQLRLAFVSFFSCFIVCSLPSSTRPAPRILSARLLCNAAAIAAASCARVSLSSTHTHTHVLCVFLSFLLHLSLFYSRSLLVMVIFSVTQTDTRTRSSSSSLMLLLPFSIVSNACFYPAECSDERAEADTRTHRDSHFSSPILSSLAVLVNVVCRIMCRVHQILTFVVSTLILIPSLLGSVCWWLLLLRFRMCGESPLPSPWHL